MADAPKHLRDSIMLDAAHLSRGVPAAIDQLADEAAKELADARDRAERDAGT